jgi:penicillin-insensitive murein endopeptidase
MHRVRKGETLGMLARKYGTSVDAIKRANGLRSNLIRAKQSYRIPRAGTAPVVRAQPVAIPRRSLPPHAPTRPTPPASAADSTSDA